MKKLLIIIFAFFNIIASATTYYVSSSGNDSNNGTSASTPWKTIAKINSSSFSPGDQILSNKGDIWSTGNIVFPSSGTSGNPITISSYGSGNAPVFSYTGASYLIRLTNKQYVVIDGIKIIDNTMSATDHSITSKIWYAIGLNNSSNITIKNCDISLVGIGIEVSNGSGYETISNNHIYNLRMVINTPGGGDDFGANPLIIGGSNNLITQNTFEEAWAPSYDYKYDGGAIEFFSNGGASISNNKITNNTVVNCNGFLEIGAASGGACANNLIAYNKIVNCGIIGSYHTTDAMKMDISNLQYYNNVVIETVSQYTNPGVLFYSPGAYPSGMLFVKNNIFWMSNGTDITWGGFTTTQMNHSNNIFRMSSGSVGIPLASSEIQSSTATLFIDASGVPSNWNLRPANGSPSINAGVNVGLTSDFAGSPLNNPPSIGVYESGSATAPAVPVYVSSAISTTAPSLLEMTYNTTLANIIPATSAFSVLVNSAARTVNTVAISGAKVQLTLASPVVSGDVVTVSYTKPAANPLQTASAGLAASISAQPVTNAVTTSLPTYVSSAVANATPSLLEMTYNTTLANILPAASAFSVLVNSGARTVSSVAISGSKVQLTLASPVVYGDIITVAYTKPASNPLQGTNGGQAVSLTSKTVTNNTVSTIPVYTSSAVQNATPTLLEMTYSLSLANIVPAAASFAVLVNSVATPVNTVAISGTKVQLTLASAIKYGDVVTVSYTKPSTNPLQTAAGVAAASISGQSVTNNLYNPTKDAPLSITLKLYPSYVHRTLNAVLTYSSSPSSTIAPEMMNISNYAGSLLVQKLLVTGATSVQMPLNLRSGIYLVKILANGKVMASQKMYVY
jgi:uncharacterized repeat protein (TIGR02059 family)